MRCGVCGAREGEYHETSCSIYGLGPPVGPIKFQPNKVDDTVNYSDLKAGSPEGQRRINLTPKPPAPLHVHSCVETTLQLLATKYMQTKRQGLEGPAEYLRKAWEALMDVGALLDG